MVYVWVAQTLHGEGDSSNCHPAFQTSLRRKGLCDSVLTHNSHPSAYVAIHNEPDGRYVQLNWLLSCKATHCDCIKISPHHALEQTVIVVCCLLHGCGVWKAREDAQAAKMCLAEQVHAVAARSAVDLQEDTLTGYRACPPCLGRVA